MVVNGIYVTALHEDKRDIVCKKDSLSTFSKGETYQYIKHHHIETGVEIWVVYSKSDESYFYTRNRMIDIFDCTPIFRDEKIDKILGQE